MHVLIPLVRAGAAAVLGALKSIALSKTKANVVVVLAIAENAIGASSYKPHAILKSAKGLTVEVSNTDAEGRLCLADAMTWAQTLYPSPAALVDVATLTGACVVALGEHCAGVFSNNDSLAKNLVDSGDQAFEECWRMPILENHRKELKGDQSDILSCGKSRYGGASTAAAFLEKFVEPKTPWAHLDIAGPAMIGTKSDFSDKGGTGFGAHLLAEFVSKHYVK